MEDGDVEPLLQPTLDLEAAGRGDVLEVDPAVGRRDPGDGVDELVDGPGLHAQRDRVDTTEPLEQHGFSFHDRHRGQGSDVAEAEDGGAVADDRDGVADARVGRGELRVRRDRARDLGDAGRVEERQVRGVAQRLGREGGELAAQMGPEHRAGGVDERRGLRVHGMHLGWLAVDGPRFGCGRQPRWWPRETRSGGGCPAGFRHCDTRSLPVGSEFRRASVWAASHVRPPAAPTLRSLWRLLRLRPTPPCSSSAAVPPACCSPARCGAAASTASLVDAYDEPLGWDRATVIHPRSLQIFESLGIVDEFTTAGVHIQACRIHADGAVLGEMDYRGNRTRYPFDIGLSEDRTEQILTRYLEGVGRRGRPVHAARGPRPAGRPGRRDARDAR